MSELPRTRLRENPDDRNPQPGFDEVRQEDVHQEDMHRERDRQREIQRRYRAGRSQDPEDLDVGSNERF